VLDLQQELVLQVVFHLLAELGVEFQLVVEDRVIRRDLENRLDQVKQKEQLGKVMEVEEVLEKVVEIYVCQKHVSYVLSLNVSFVRMQLVHCHNCLGQSHMMMMMNHRNCLGQNHMMMMMNHSYYHCYHMILNHSCYHNLKLLLANHKHLFVHSIQD
jgi:hypothetical protein